MSWRDVPDKDVPDRQGKFREYYDQREARLKRLGEEIEQWEPREGEVGEEEVDDYYQEVGRLEARLEATRHDLEELRERGTWEEVRDDIDQAISDLEEAIARAAPRYQ